MSPRKFLTILAALAVLIFVGGVAVGASWERHNSSEVLRAETFEQAVEQCLTLDKSEINDCIGAAQIAWCEFEPFQPGEEFYDPEIDGRCLAENA